MAKGSRSQAVGRVLYWVGGMLLGVGVGAYLPRFTGYWPLVAWALLAAGGISMMAGLFLQVHTR